MLRELITFYSPLGMLAMVGLMIVGGIAIITSPFILYIFFIEKDVAPNDAKDKSGRECDMYPLYWTNR